MNERPGNVTESPDKPELIITRTCAAPREIVFTAWTEVEPLQRWWGPRGFTNPVCEIDPWPGGAIRIHMRAPDGTVYPMTGAYVEIVAPHCIVFTSSALDEKGKPLFEVMTTVTLDDHGPRTELTLQAKVVQATAGAARHLAGMEQGWSQSLERLAEEVASMVRNAKESVITRVLP